MKQTANRGYPWPECDPPYVKDAADLPRQLKALAEAIDDDVTGLGVLIADAVSPSAGLIESTTPQLLAEGAAFDYTTVVFTTPGVADIANNQLVATTDGLYTITGTCSASSSFDPQAAALDILVNGVTLPGVFIKNGTVAGEAIFNNVVNRVILQTGDLVTMVQSNTGPVTYQFVRLGMVRQVKL